MIVNKIGLVTRMSVFHSIYSIANIYKKVTGNSSYCLPIEALFGGVELHPAKVTFLAKLSYASGTLGSEASASFTFSSG